MARSTLPRAAASFRNCSSMASRVASGSAIWVPITDQLPQLIARNCSSLAGVAANAQAVSWQAGTIIGTRPRPSSRPTDGRSGLMTVAEGINSPGNEVGKSKQASRSNPSHAPIDCRTG